MSISIPWVGDSGSRLLLQAPSCSSQPLVRPFPALPWELCGLGGTARRTLGGLFTVVLSGWVALEQWWEVLVTFWEV